MGWDATKEATGSRKQESTVKKWQQFIYSVKTAKVKQKKQPLNKLWHL